jgi:hypothetical protein
MNKSQQVLDLLDEKKKKKRKKAASSPKQNCMCLPGSPFCVCPAGIISNPFVAFPRFGFPQYPYGNNGGWHQGHGHHDHDHGDNPPPSEPPPSPPPAPESLNKAKQLLGLLVTENISDEILNIGKMAAGTIIADIIHDQVTKHKNLEPMQIANKVIEYLHGVANDLDDNDLELYNKIVMKLQALKKKYKPVKEDDGPPTAPPAGTASNADLAGRDTGPAFNIPPGSLGPTPRPGFGLVTAYGKWYKYIPKSGIKKRKKKKKNESLLEYTDRYSGGYQDQAHKEHIVSSSDSLQVVQDALKKMDKEDSWPEGAVPFIQDHKEKKQALWGENPDSPMGDWDSFENNSQGESSCMNKAQILSKLVSESKDPAEKKKLQSEIDALGAQIDKKDDQGVDTHHLKQKLRDLRKKLAEIKDPSWMSGPDHKDPEEGLLHLFKNTKPEVVADLVKKINHAWPEAEAQDQSEDGEMGIGVFYWDSADYGDMIKIVGKHLEIAEPSLNHVKDRERPDDEEDEE